MSNLSLENSLFMYSRGWFPIARGFKSKKSIMNNKEISLAREELTYVVNRFNNANENEILPWALEINSFEKKLDELYKKAENDPLAGNNC